MPKIRRESPRIFMFTSVSRSDDQWVIHIKRRLCPEMLYFGFIPIPEIVETQAVVFGVDDFYQALLYLPHFRCIRVALKHRILDPYPIVYALFGDRAKPLFPGRRFGVVR
jgi:hypothetical protein